MGGTHCSSSSSDISRHFYCLSPLLSLGRIPGNLTAEALSAGTRRQVPLMSSWALDFSMIEPLLLESRVECEGQMGLKQVLPRLEHCHSYVVAKDFTYV